MITAEELRIEEIRLQYLELIDKPDVFPTRKNWDFIIKNAMRGMALPLYRKYLTAITIDDNDREELHDIAIEKFPEYIRMANREEALQAIYSDIVTAPFETQKLLRENCLFDADYLIDLIEAGELNFALSVIDCYKPEYTEIDLEAIEELLEIIERLPDVGTIESRNGIFGVSEKYICPDGHVNNADVEFCTHSGCGKDIRGLTSQQEDKVLALSRRFAALKSLLRR